MSTPTRVKRITDEISGVVAQSGVTSWELNFLDHIKLWSGKLTTKQEKTLCGIEQKVFPDEDAEDDGEEEGVQRTDDRFNRGRR